MSQPIILRADGSSQFGMGHIFRCLGLAQGLQEKGYMPLFMIKDHAPAPMEVIKGFGFKVQSIDRAKDFDQEAQSIIETAKALKAAAVIIDLNHSATMSNEAGFENFLKKIKDAGLHILMVDGLGAEGISSRRALAVDVLLIPYAGAQEGNYKTNKGTQVLLGPAYFPFQKNFLSAAAKIKTIEKKGKRILISMGGGDVSRLNEKILQAILSLDLPDLELKVTGTINSRSLQQAFANSKGRLELLRYSAQMPELLQWADLVLLSSGLTKYEAALLGTPAIAVSFTKNHDELMKKFAQAGSLRYLGFMDEVTGTTIAQATKQLLEDEPLRKQMSLKGKNLIDGHGLERIIQKIPLEVSL